MKKLLIVLLLTGVLFINGCVESTTISKSTAEMALDKNDLPLGWELENYYSHDGFTNVKFKNTFNNDSLYIDVDKFRSSEMVEKWFKTGKAESEQWIRSGDVIEINTKGIFRKNTQCFSYVNTPNYSGDPNVYVIECGIKNIRFSLGLASMEPVKKENEEMILNLAKTIETKIIS